MAKASLDINGRKYVLGCDDGEEDHLIRLGEKLNARITELANQFGQIGDLRLLVMAGITLTDENEELRQAPQTSAPQSAQADTVASQAAVAKAEAQARLMAEDMRKQAEATQIEADTVKAQAQQDTDKAEQVKADAADSLLDAALRIERLAERLSARRKN